MQVFKNYLLVECGLSQNTVDAYLSDLRMFRDYLSTQREGLNLNIFESSDVSFFIQLRSTLDCNATVRRRVASIRVWVKFLYTVLGRDVAHLLAQIDMPKASRSLPVVIGRQAVVKLISSASDARGAAILELLYASGLRASELCSLTKANIDFHARSVRVVGKGNKERIVPFGLPAAKALVRYFATRKDTLGCAFEYNGQQLNRRELHRIVKAAWEVSGIAQHVSPHTLRHCFASHLLSGHDAIEIGRDGIAVNLENGGANIRVVQELLGHNSVNTTQIYTHVDLRRLKQVHALLGR